MRGVFIRRSVGDEAGVGYWDVRDVSLLRLVGDDIGVAVGVAYVRVVVTTVVVVVVTSLIKVEPAGTSTSWSVCTIHYSNKI